MWPFKHAKTSQQRKHFGPPCSYCMSTNTVVISYHATEWLNHIRTWRSRRYVTCRCADCGRDFYTEEPQEGLPEEVLSNDGMIYDKDELRAAEEEVRREADEEGNHRYKLNEP